MCLLLCIGVFTDMCGLWLLFWYLMVTWCNLTLYCFFRVGWLVG